MATWTSVQEEGYRGIPKISRIIAENSDQVKIMIEYRKVGGHEEPGPRNANPWWQCIMGKITLEVEKIPKNSLDRENLL